MILPEKSKVGMMYFLWIASTAAWYPMINLYFEKSGFNGVEIGVLASIIPMVMLLGQPFVNLLADKFGRKQMLTLILFSASLAILGLLFKGSFAFIFVCMALFALCFAPINPLVDSTVLDFVDTSKGSSYSKMRMWGAIGWMTCSFITGYVVFGQSLYWIFIIGSILMVATAIVSRLIKFKTKPTDELPLKFSEVKKIIADPKVLVFLLVLVLYGIGSTPINTFYSIYLNKIGASSKLIGLSFTIQALSELPFLFFASMLVKKYGAIQIIAIAILASVVRIFSYTQIANPYLALGLDLSNGICYSLFLVGAVEFVNEIVPVKLRATGQSLIWAAYVGAGVMIGNLLTGYIYQNSSIQTAFIVDASVLVVAAILTLMMIKQNIFSEVKTQNAVLVS